MHAWTFVCVCFSVYACVNSLVFVAESVLIGFAHYSIPTPPGGTNSRLSHTKLYATVTHFITTIYYSAKLTISRRKTNRR